MAKKESGPYASFNAFFKFELLPVLEELDRVRTIRLCVFACLGAALVTLGVLLVMYTPFEHARAGLVIFTVGLLAALCVVVYVDGVRYNIHSRKERFSLQAIAPTVDFARPNLRHAPKEYLPLGRYVDSCLFQGDFTNYTGRELFRGMGDGYSLAFSWLKVEDLSGDGGRPYRCLFRGWFFMATFPNRFDGETWMAPDTAEAAFSWLGRAVQGITVPKTGVLVQLEDADFERLFKVLSTDQLDARYVMTPAFMRTAARVGARLSGKIHCYFRDYAMYAGVPAEHEYFGAMPVRPFQDPGFLRQLYHAASGVDELARAVATHQKVWAK